MRVMSSQGAASPGRGRIHCRPMIAAIASEESVAFMIFSVFPSLASFVRFVSFVLKAPPFTEDS
jgi:hypothetical protein